MLKLGAQVDRGGQHNLANFDEDDSINGDEQECTEAQHQPFVDLELEFVELVDHVGVATFFNGHIFDVGPR